MVRPERKHAEKLHLSFLINSEPKIFYAIIGEILSHVAALAMTEIFHKNNIEFK